MKTDTELEALLRSTLAGRAERIDDAPPFIEPAHARRHLRRWVPAVAAAVAVIAVAASIAIAKSINRSAPAHPSPSPTVTSSPTPTTTCTTSIPASWDQAVKRAVVAPNGTNLEPLGVAPNGTVLAVRGANVDTDRFEMAIVTPDRQASTVILRLGPNIVADRRPATINNRWAVFGTRNVAWTNDAILWVIDLQHDLPARKVVDLTAQGVTGDETLQDWALLGDNLYYTASDTYRSEHYRLYRYDLRTDAQTQIASGPRLTMHSVYRSLSHRSRPTDSTWGPQVVVVPGDLPSNVPAAVTDGEHTVVSDGTDVAWSESGRTPAGRPVQTAYWWSPNSGEPVIALERRVSGDPHDPPAFEITAVAGPFVFLDQYDISATHVLDARTRVDAAWLTHDQYAAWFAWAAGGGRVAIEYSSEKLGPNTLYVPNISSLPPLSC